MSDSVCVLTSFKSRSPSLTRFMKGRPHVFNPHVFNEIVVQGETGAGSRERQGSSALMTRGV